MEELSRLDPYFPFGFAAVFLILIAFLYVIPTFIKSKKTRRNTFLLVGLCDSGKTTLYHQFRYGLFVNTYTSMAENEGTFPLESEITNTRAQSSPLNIIDLPGHQKQRFRFPDFAAISGGIIFLIDASSFGHNIVPVSDFLYDVLSNDLVIKNKIPILIVCNKQDLLTSYRSNLIRSNLEKEFNKLRLTRSAAPDQTGTQNSNIFLGFEGKEFTFEDIENQIDFVESSAKNGKSDIEQIEQWMRGLAPF